MKLLSENIIKDIRKELIMVKKESNVRIYVETLGGLTITIGDKSISNHSQQSKKPWMLLAYLIAFRNKDISTTELIDVFWGEDGGTNPSSALKTLLFRVRKLLEPLGIPTHTLIVHQQGSYAWTKELVTEVDTDRFDLLCRTAFSKETNSHQCKKAAIEAFALYKGDFLPQYSWENWVMPINTCYHNLYIKMTHLLLDLYLAESAYQQIVSICRQAVTVEPYDENFHYYLIHALYSMGNAHAALEHYTHMTNMFYNEFAITPSDKLKELYKVIQSKERQTVTDLTTIQNEFQKDSSRTGAFFCEYAVFKDIYLLESRALARTGDSLYLCLITVSGANSGVLRPALLSRVMKELLESIHSSLRRGDVCSRFSTNQYILLLPSASYENGEKVLQRILQAVGAAHSHKGVEMAYALQAVIPSPENRTSQKER